MTSAIATSPRFKFFTNSGAPASDCHLFTYGAGSLVPKTTWQDQGQTTANTNPIVLDANGECVIWLDAGQEYKFVLKTSGGSVLSTTDDISGTDSLLRADLAQPSGSSLVGFIQSGIGAVKSTAEDKLRESVSVKDYGAKGDGVTDDTLAIQRAINSLPATGGVVCFPPGIYRTTDTIFIGNGTDSTASTVNCIRLVGVGGGKAGAWPHDSGFGSVIRYDGGTAKPIIRILGPINSPGVEGIALDGNSRKASHGIWLTSVIAGKFDDVSIKDVATVGIKTDCAVGPFASTWNTIYCEFSNLWINIGSSPYATCVLYSGSVGNTADTNLCNMRNVFLLYSGTHGKGIQLDYADSNYFENINCYRNGADDGSTYGVLFNGTVFPPYPDQNTFVHFNGPNQATNAAAVFGSPNKNFFYSWMEGDGAVIPSSPAISGITTTGKVFGGFSFGGATFLKYADVKTFSVTVGSIPANSSVDSLVAFPGCIVGDSVSVSLVAAGQPTNGHSLSGFVSGPGSIFIRWVNSTIGTSAPIAGAQNYRVEVRRYA